MAGIIQLFFTALFNVNIRNKQRNMTTSSMPVKDTIFMAVRDCEQVYTRFIHSFIHSFIHGVLYYFFVNLVGNLIVLDG